MRNLLSRRINRVFIAFVLVSALILGSSEGSVYAGTKKVYTRSVKYKKIVTLSNYNSCGNMGCIASNGNTVYALKTNGNNNVSKLYCYKNFDPKKPAANKCAKPKTVKNVGHGNGMCYYNKYLYVAPAAKEDSKKNIINRVNPSDGKKKDVTVNFPKVNGKEIKHSIYNISTFTWDKTVNAQTFIFFVGKTTVNSKSYYRYVRGYLTKDNKNNPIIQFMNYFYVPYNSNYAYSTGQDSFYYKNKLYIPTSLVTTDSKGKEKIVKNKVVVCNLGAPTGKYTNGNLVYYGKIFGLETSLTINKSTKKTAENYKYSKFEVESMCTLTNGTFLFCTNGEKSGKNQDALYTVTFDKSKTYKVN